MEYRKRRFWRSLCGLLAVLLLGAAAVPAYAAADRQEPQLNVLLIGHDRQEGERTTRSDTMILCSFAPDRKQLVLTSFLRDLYVPIPGHGKNRINAAYAIGGAPLLKQTVEENFEVAIDGTIEVDFSQFSRIIDLLGGVEIELRRDEAALITRETGYDTQPGLQKLNGAQALSYARIRRLDRDGDFTRTQRQRAVLEAVWDTYKGSSLPTLIRVIGSLLPVLETDFGSGELIQAAVRIFPHLQQLQIVSARIPEDGAYTHRTVDGMQVLVADMDAARSRLHSLIYSPGG